MEPGVGEPAGRNAQFRMTKKGWQLNLKSVVRYLPAGSELRFIRIRWDTKIQFLESSGEITRGVKPQTKKTMNDLKSSTDPKALDKPQPSSCPCRGAQVLSIDSQDKWAHRVLTGGPA